VNIAEIAKAANSARFNNRELVYGRQKVVNGNAGISYIVVDNSKIAYVFVTDDAISGGKGDRIDPGSNFGATTQLVMNDSNGRNFQQFIVPTSGWIELEGKFAAQAQALAGRV